ncbi:DUF6809 family protein [Paenibacillus turicensis]|uniref:DUF6809 family protein n=1 Tax=Paenibacillus turicensis TaxID=160487 RepID=UPI003D2E3D11
MKPLIEQLYNGTLSPDEAGMSNNPKYREISHQISEYLQTWRSNHSEAEWQQLEQLLDLYAQTHSMELTATFTNGFRLGAGLMVETLTGEEQLAFHIASMRNK